MREKRHTRWSRVIWHLFQKYSIYSEVELRFLSKEHSKELQTAQRSHFPILTILVFVDGKNSVEHTGVMTSACIILIQSLQQKTGRFLCLFVKEKNSTDNYFYNYFCNLYNSSLHNLTFYNALSLKIDCFHVSSKNSLLWTVKLASNQILV